MLVSEKIVLTPAIVHEEARKLAAVGDYRSALKLLEENKIEVEVYDERITMKISERNWHKGMKGKKGNIGNYFKSNRNWRKQGK